MKSSKNIILAIVLTGILVGVWSICAAQGQKEVAWEGGIKKPQGDWHIGVTLDHINHPFKATMHKGFLDAAKKYGFTAEMRDGESDAAKQVQIIGEFIVKKVDLIIVCPIVRGALVSAIRKANDAKIPVIITNRALGSGADTVTYVGADDYTGGRIQGQLIAEVLKGKGNIVVLQGTIGSSPQVDRSKGLADVLAGYPGIKIVAEYPSDFDRGKALASTQDALGKYPAGKLDAIVSQDSEMCMTALQAVQAAGRKELIGKIVSFDFPSYVKENIKNGKFYGTVLQDPYQQAVLTMDTAWLYLSGNGGHIPRPAFFTPLPKVTKVNVDLFAASW